MPVENDALRDDAAAGRRRFIKSSSSAAWKPPSPPAWIMQPPPDWQTPLNGIISPRREADHYQKTTGRNLRSILMSSVDRVAHIDGQPMQCREHTMRFQRSINA